MADRPTDGRAYIPIGQQFRREMRWRIGNKAIRLLIRREKRFDLAPQLRIAPHVSSRNPLRS